MTDIETMRRRINDAARAQSPGEATRRWRDLGEALPAVLDELESTRQERDDLRRELHASTRAVESLFEFDCLYCHDTGDAGGDPCQRCG